MTQAQALLAPAHLSFMLWAQPVLWHHQIGAVTAACVPQPERCILQYKTALSKHVYTCTAMAEPPAPISVIFDVARLQGESPA